MLSTVILCQNCGLWSRFGGRSEVFPRLVLDEQFTWGRGMPCGGGWWVSAQLALMGGRGRGGLWHLRTLVTCLGSQGTLCPCSLLMIRVGRPWNLLLLLVGPGPPGSFKLLARPNDEARFQSSYRLYRCRRHTPTLHYCTVYTSR
jgi:hypothetical protein